MPCFLVFDFETTGLIRDRLPDDHEDQPHPVSVAGILFDEDGTELKVLHRLVRPEGWVIPAAATAVHGITTEQALREGVSETHAVLALLSLADRADERIAHNEAFDSRIMAICLARLARRWLLQRHGCTMAATRDICRLPPTERMIAAGYGHGYKAPKLTEAHEHVLGRPLEGAHDALADARGCMAVFLELRRRRAEQRLKAVDRALAAAD
jgi:DNA polymerase III subunit epsilon